MYAGRRFFNQVLEHRIDDDCFGAGVRRSGEDTSACAWPEHRRAECDDSDPPGRRLLDIVGHDAHRWHAVEFSAARLAAVALGHRFAVFSSRFVAVPGGRGVDVVSRFQPLDRRQHGRVVHRGNGLRNPRRLFQRGALQELFPLPDPVLGGIAAFALGHLCYIAGCVRVARRLNFAPRARFWGPIIFWQLFALVGWYLVVFRGARSGPTLLVWAALPYSLLLAGLTGLASGLALADRRFIALAVGGILFLASDLILAFEMFRGTFPHATHAVWLTYGPAQMLIVYSLGLIGRVECEPDQATPNA